MRSVFMGSDPIALPFLQSLRKAIPAIEWRAVFTQPDRPKGRGQRLQANPIKQWAHAEGLPVRQPRRCGKEEVEWMASEGIDLVLVMAYGQLLKPAFLEQPRIGPYNLHTSLLPKYRGASPIHTALAEGETTTGVSLMRIIPEMDAGPVVDQETVEIGARMTAPELIDALAAACVSLLARALPRVLAGEAHLHPQDPGAVTYCRRIFKEDAGLDFRAPATVLERRIRAFQPWPGSLFVASGTPLKMGAAEVVASPGGAPGTVHRPSDTEILVTCGADALRLTRLQRPGGRMLAAEDFLRGFPLGPETVLETHTMAPLVARRPFPWKWRPGDPLDWMQ